jgi:hypothetical protein
MAARVVRDREHVDARVLRERAGDPLQLAAARRGDQAAARDELGRDDERALPREELPEGRQDGTPSAATSGVP